MKLTVTTPLAIILETDGVAHVRAEDDSGVFGILSGHAAFLTALSVSVVSWRDAAGTDHHVAVRGGMLTVRNGETITIATREAVADDDLRHLQSEVLGAFARRDEEEHTAHLDAQRLYLAAVRQIYHFLRLKRSGGMPRLLSPGDLDS